MSGRLITTSKKSYTPWNPAVRARVERDLKKAAEEAEEREESERGSVVDRLRNGGR